MSLDDLGVIAKTASRNVAFKAARLGDSIFDLQSEILMTEAVTVNSPSHEEDFGDGANRSNTCLILGNGHPLELVLLFKALFVDFRALNNNTNSSGWPLPNI